MNKEAYVSFEIAELLNNNGFNWECRSFYEYFSSMITMYQGMLPELSEAARNYNKEEHRDICSRPTQQMAMRWLREEKELMISVILALDVYVDNHYHWTWGIQDNQSHWVFLRGQVYEDTYEDAVEAALEYALTNLI